MRAHTRRLALDHTTTHTHTKKNSRAAVSFRDASLFPIFTTGLDELRRLGPGSSSSEDGGGGLVGDGMPPLSSSPSSSSALLLAGGAGGGGSGGGDLGAAQPSQPATARTPSGNTGGGGSRVGGS